MLECWGGNGYEDDPYEYYYYDETDNFIFLGLLGDGSDTANQLTPVDP